MTQEFSFEIYLVCLPETFLYDSFSCFPHSWHGAYITLEIPLRLLDISYKTKQLRIKIKIKLKNFRIDTLKEPDQEIQEPKTPKQLSAFF